MRRKMTQGKRRNAAHSKRFATSGGTSPPNWNRGARRRLHAIVAYLSQIASDRSPATTARRRTDDPEHVEKLTRPPRRQEPRAAGQAPVRAVQRGGRGSDWRSFDP